jgi:hypothetical protein
MERPLDVEMRLGFGQTVSKEPRGKPRGISEFQIHLSFV